MNQPLMCVVVQKKERRRRSQEELERIKTRGTSVHQ